MLIPAVGVLLALSALPGSPGAVRREVLTVNVRSPESMPTGEEGTGTPGLQVHLTGSRAAAEKALPGPCT